MLKSSIPSISGTGNLFAAQNKKSIEDIEFDFLCEILQTRRIGYIVSFDIFPNQEKCLIADNVSQQAQTNYSEFFYYSGDHYIKHSNALKIENASASDVEEDNANAEADSENDDDSNDSDKQSSVKF